MLKYLFLLFGVVFTTQGLYCQEKWTREGDRMYARGNYPEAIELYQWAVKREEGPLAFAGLGRCYLKIKDVKAACKAFEKIDFNEFKEANVRLDYARALMGKGLYGSAMSQVLPVLSQFPEHEQAQVMLQACMNPYDLLADSNRFSIQKAPFNSPVSDFSPVPFQDGLVYATSLDNRVGVNYTSRTHEESLVDLYFIPRKDSLEWGTPKPLKGKVNTRLNDGPATFDAVQNRIYFTRNNLLGGKRGFSSERIDKLQLYTAVWDEEQGWVEVETLPFNDKEYSFGHPSISKDGKTLYFASDQPGGYGGTDLYKVRKEEDGWGKVENLGPTVNTDGNEMFPFIHADGNLIFASDGHRGLGGLDLFSALVTESGTGMVTHLGVPLNSTADDFALVLDSARKTGFFSSNRGEDPLNDDIYSVSVLWPEFKCFPQEEPNLCFSFSEGGTLSDPENSGLQYQWDFGDGTYKKGLEVDHCFPGTGRYLVRLNLIDSVSQFVFMNEAEYTLEVLNPEQVYIDISDAVLPGDPIDISGKNSKVEDCEIKEYYWDLGDGRRFTGSEVAITYEQAGEYEIRLGVVGRTKDGQECKACTSRLLQVLEKKDLAAHLKKKAEEKMKMEGGGFIPESEALFSEKQNSLPTIETVATRKFSLMNREIDFYRVQIAQSDTQIPTDSSYFKGMQDISEFQEDDHFVYTIGKEKEPVKLFPLYKQAVNLQFEPTIVVAFEEENIVSGHDSTFYINFPQTEAPHGVTMVSGQITDMEGKPVKGNIVVEDLIRGEIFATATSTEDGRYYMRLPNGSLYGITAEIGNYYSISDFVDLRDEEETSEYVGKIKVVTIDEMVESGKAYTLKNIFFDYDHYTLRPESNKSLDKLARILIENPELKVEIRGHTDSRGDDLYNLRLSKRRASEVLKYLILSGYNVDNIISNGYGETIPVANNDTPEGRQLNRRVEFRFFRDELPPN